MIRKIIQELHLKVVHLMRIMQMSLLKFFEKIQHTVTEDTAIQNATITDVIDPRFVILDEEGNAITADQLKDGKNSPS